MERVRAKRERLVAAAAYDRCGGLMARRTLADRLQAGFETIPTTPEFAHPTPPPEARVWTRADTIRKWTIGVPLLAVCVLAGLGLAGYVVGSGIWWRTASSATCTVTAAERDFHSDGKGGPGVVWVIRTSDCGTLQVTSGGDGMRIADADRLGESLQFGRTYRFELRGWDWIGEPRAIVGARSDGARQ